MSKKKRKSAKSQRNMKRPLAFIVMLAGSTFAGLITGGVIGLIAGLIMKNALFGLGGLAGAMGGLIIGYPIGVILGITLMKRLLRQDGPLWLAILLCLVGAAGSLGIAELAQVSMTISLPAYFILTPVLGTAGFFLGKRQSSPKSK